MLYRGRCHCGDVAYDVEGEIEAAVACNCSFCQRRGSLLWATPHGRLRVTKGEDRLSAYTFGRRAIAHRFCRSCGIHPFSEDVSETGERSAYINIRCLDDIDLATIPVIPFDGRAV